MPKAYEDVRDSLLRRRTPSGKPMFTRDEAEESAAKIYNGAIRKPGQPPMTRNYEKTAANWRKGKGK